jgi:hypothetical protein
MTAIIAIFACLAVLWWVVRSLCDLQWQAVIARDIEALLDRHDQIRVNLSERQIRYLGQWGYDVSPLEAADDGLWYSEVRR